MDDLNNTQGPRLILPVSVKESLEPEARSQTITALGRAARLVADGHVCGISLVLVMPNETGTGYEAPAHVISTKKSGWFMAEALVATADGLRGQIPLDGDKATDFEPVTVIESGGEH